MLLCSDSESEVDSEIDVLSLCEFEVEVESLSSLDESLSRCDSERDVDSDCESLVEVLPLCESATDVESLEDVLSC